MSETAKFFRFPEEYFFIRAEDTITVDLAAEADVHTDCPDTAAIGTSIVCTVTVESFSNVPTASVAVTPPAQFTNETLMPDVDPGDWDCTCSTTCDLHRRRRHAAGRHLHVRRRGRRRRARRAPWTSAPRSRTSGTDIASDCDEVQVFEDDTDTTLEIDKTTTVTEVDPGAAAYTVTLRHRPEPGGRPAGVRDTAAAPGGATIRFVCGDGTWACTSAATLECTAPTLPLGGVVTFEVAGR